MGIDITTDVAIEMELISSDGWTDVTEDVLFDQTIRWRYGNQGFAPNRRVASPGTFQFMLDNDTTNSGGVKGYYSPGSTDVRPGFAQKIPVRVSLTYDGDTYYKWTGRIKRVTPTAGLWGERVTKVEAGDWIQDATKLRPTGLAVQVTQRGNDLLTEALTKVTKQPTNTTFSEGRSTFEYAFDEVRDNTTTLYQIMQNIANSEFGVISPVGDTDGAGNLTFWHRHERPTTTDILISMDDDGDGDDFDSILAVSDENLVFNVINAQSFPRAVSTDQTEILWQQQDSLSIPAGNTETITAYYRDPSNPDVRIAATSFQGLQSTDYTWSQASTDLDISLTQGGNATEVAITNNGPTAGDLSGLTLRGSKVVVYDPNTTESRDSDSVEDHGERQLNLRLLYQQNPLEAQDFADFTLTNYKDEKLRVRQVEFTANVSSDLMIAACQGEPGSKITLSESVLDISGDYFIEGVEQRLERNILKTVWFLDEAITTAYWILGTSQLDTDTILGF